MEFNNQIGRSWWKRLYEICETPTAHAESRCGSGKIGGVAIVTFLPLSYIVVNLVHAHDVANVPKVMVYNIYSSY